jgi:hypothetical protein
MAVLVYGLALVMPTDPNLVTALGQLVIAHTQLELVLRYMIKTLSGLDLVEALDGTAEDRMPDLRARIKQLFRDKKATATERLKLDALLLNAKQLTEKRNDYLHAVYSSTAAGQDLMKGADHVWGPAPTPDEVRAVTNDLLTLSKKLNEARQEGFIADVARRRLIKTSPSSVGHE